VLDQVVHETKLSTFNPFKTDQRPLDTIIDARVLALELTRQDNISLALKMYEAHSEDAVNNIVIVNREESETRFLEIIDKKCPNDDEEYDIDSIITQEELRQISKNYKKVAGFDPVELNERESFTFESVLI